MRETLQQIVNSYPEASKQNYINTRERALQQKRERGEPIQTVEGLLSSEKQDAETQFEKLLA